MTSAELRRIVDEVVKAWKSDWLELLAAKPDIGAKPDREVSMATFDLCMAIDIAIQTKGLMSYRDYLNVRVDVVDIRRRARRAAARYRRKT